MEKIPRSAAEGDVLRTVVNGNSNSDAPPDQPGTRLDEPGRSQTAGDSQSSNEGDEFRTRLDDAGRSQTDGKPPPNQWNASPGDDLATQPADSTAVGGAAARYRGGFNDQTPAVLSGRTLVPGGKFGRYQILKPLGEGGMGLVFLAHDEELGRKVALKVPRVEIDSDPDSVQRFLREAKAAAGISHPNICPVFDVGQIDGMRYITMLYLEGESLREAIGRGEKFSPAAACRLVQTIARAVDEAHRQGIVHRDLKPANIFMNRGVDPIIVDFGLARLTQATDALTTRSGALMGTPAYMAPEQIGEDELGKVGPAADIYSLGVVLYELLTGRRPHVPNETTNLLQMLLTVPPAPLLSVCPGIHPDLAAVCMRALERQPQNRYKSASEFAAALAPFVHETGPAQPPDPPRFDPIGRNRGVLIATAAITILAGLYAIYEWNARSTPPAAGARPGGVEQSANGNTNEAALVPRDSDGKLPVTTPSHESDNPPVDVSPVDKSGNRRIPKGQLKGRLQELKQQAGVPSVVSADRVAVTTFEVHLQRANEKAGGYRIMGPGEPPLRDYDKVQLHVKLDRPGYIYFFWFDAEGLANYLEPKAPGGVQKLTEAWSPEPAVRDELQEWHLIGGERGVELVIAVVSERQLSRQELSELEQVQIYIGAADAGGLIASLDTTRGVVGTVKSPKLLVKKTKRTAPSLVLLVSQRAASGLYEIDSRDETSASKANRPVSVQAFIREKGDFHEYLQKRFAGYRGVIVKHE